MDIKYKKEKLSSINDEVQEFHPVLDALFKNMKDITRVEYTHGQFEFGADFILTKIDQILKETEYIGIIAKINNITQSNLIDIERQIQETETHRYSSNGKKEIYISEVWVVTNGTISHNAQQLIHDKYKSKKIKFIDAELLIKLIDEYIKYFWLDISIKISDLINKIYFQNEEIDKSQSLIQSNGNNFYIEQDILEAYDSLYHSDKKRKMKKRRIVDIDELISNEDFILIEGGMGSGKSKLMRKIVSNYASVLKYIETKIIPIYITYIDFVNEYDLNIDKLIQNYISDYSRDDFSKTTFLILIDGFDEKKEEPKKQIEILKNICDEDFKEKNIKVIITSRFLSSFIDENIQLPQCKRLEIAPLTIRKTIRFLEELCKSINISSRILEDIKKSHLMKDLPRSPIAAILLAKLINENSKDIPANMTELYSRYLELMLGRWDIEKGLESQKEYQTAERIIMNFAEYLIDNNIPSVSRDECMGYFNDYLKKRNIDIDAELLFEKMISRSNIISEDLTKKNVFFTHRTFAEYYYAKQKLLNRDLDINNRAFQLYWMNIYFFYIGLYQDCPELLRSLMDIEVYDESELWIKIINMSNYFLAGYSSPYEIVESSLHKIMIKASELYLSIIEKKIESPFSSLSEIHLLWWIQLIIRESYSYDYFTKAFDEAILLIEDASIDDRVKVYAIFFIGVISLDLGNKTAFDYLIDKYKSSLPLQLQFALYYEGKRLDDPSQVLKKQMKKLKQKVKSYDENQIKNLHEKPIKIKKIT